MQQHGECCILACFFCLWSYEMHVNNDMEMAFNYRGSGRFTCPTKILLAKGTAHGNLKPFGTKIKVNTFTKCVLGLLKNYRRRRRWRNRGLAISRMAL